MVARLVQLRRSGDGRPSPGPASDPTADRGYESALDRGVNFAAVLADASGRNPDLALEVPEWPLPPKDLEERVWRALHEVADPEFPISLVDLGLVYGIDVSEEERGEGATVRVALTLTATACPCVEFIKWDVRDRLLEEAGVRDVDVRITWDPPWTTDRISERGRAALRRAGVSI